MQLELFESGGTKISHVTTYEYLLLLSPSYAIKEKVAQKKHLLNKEIGISTENLRSIAHVSLAKFISPFSERFLFSLIKNVAENFKPFKLEIKELEEFDHGHSRSLVLKFKDDEYVKRVQEYLSMVLRLNRGTFDPHLTIARSVPFEDAQRINNLHDYFFEGSFDCHKITVLKKPLRSKRRYELVAEIGFGRS